MVVSMVEVSSPGQRGQCATMAWVDGLEDAAAHPTSEQRNRAPTLLLKGGWRFVASIGIPTPPYNARASVAGRPRNVSLTHDARFATGSARPVVHSLKVERVNDRHYATQDEARADLADYIERFYNRQRRHSTLGYLSPVIYELRHAA
jgi:transposase InsO family protein